MTEPDVTLTDYGLAVECALCVYLLHRRGRERTWLLPWLVFFFAAVGGAALAGGSVHGFFLDERTVGHLILWRATLIFIGGTALAVWAIGSRIWFAPASVRRIDMVVWIAFAIYAAVVVFVSQEFLAAVVFYLPAAVFLLIVLARAYTRVRERSFLLALSGLGLTFVATAVQVGRIALHPTYFNHNALYHVIQAVALWLLFLGLRSVAPTSERLAS